MSEFLRQHMDAILVGLAVLVGFSEIGKISRALSAIELELCKIRKGDKF